MLTSPDFLVASLHPALHLKTTEGHAQIYEHTRIHPTMRLELTPTAACTLQLSSPSSSSSDPPLVFIDDEPFLIEFQGKLELPPGESEQAAAENTGGDEMEGARVGKVDLSDPVRRVSLAIKDVRPSNRSTGAEEEGRWSRRAIFAGFSPLFPFTNLFSSLHSLSPFGSCRRNPSSVSHITD